MSIDKFYSHIFFDLDRTLWDFQKNSQEVLADLFKNYLSEQTFVNFVNFISIFERNNESLWRKYRDKLIGKEKLSWYRFYITLQQVGIESEFLARQMGNAYVEISKTKLNLFPNTQEVLIDLSARYPLYIITNGFEEVQFAKISNCNLAPFFSNVFTSERVGAQKPNPAIFLHALESINAEPENCIMIGDDIEADIRGASEVGMDQIFVNHNQRKVSFKPTYEVHNLIEILNIL